MLAFSSSSEEPGESPFSRPGHFREAADNYDCAGIGQPAPTITRPEDGHQSPRVVRKNHTKDIDLSDTDYPASAR
jgi:hypothetical protein